MSLFLAYGLLGALLAIAAYLSLAYRAQKTPQLGHAVEIILSAIGLGGGVKICWYTLSGRVSNAIELARHYDPSSISFSEEDFVYFAIGGFALIWISLETVVRRLWSSYNKKF